MLTAEGGKTMEPGATVLRRLAVLVCALALFGALQVQTASAQETGRITGQVTSAQNMRPLEGAQVSIEGTGMGGLANAQGRFLLLNVPAGNYTVRVTMIGYGTSRQQVTVAAGQVANADFQLDETALALDEIVVTGTAAEVRAKEVGNSLDAVTAREIENVPVLKNSEDILAGRAPGVTVMTNSGQPGGGSTVKIRGINTISQTMQPLIYVDGVRIYNEPSRANWGARAATTPLQDISARDIERIEVVKGAAATTLYGTEASAGVIQILDGGSHGRVQPTAVVPGEPRQGPERPVHEVRQPRDAVLPEPAGVRDELEPGGQDLHAGPDLPVRRHVAGARRHRQLQPRRAWRSRGRHLLPVGQLQRQSRDAAHVALP